MMDFANMAIKKFSKGMTTALTSIIMGTKKASEAFKEFGIAMVTAIVEFVVQYGIEMLLLWAMSALLTKLVIGQANAIGAAWAEPAAIPAAAAIIGVSALTSALAAKSAAMTTGFGAMAGVGAGFGDVSQGTGVSSGHATGGWVGLRGPEEL
jgi:hypothetical protein